MPKIIKNNIEYGGGSADWGKISGPIEDQTDLQAEFYSKVDKVAGKGLSTEDYTTTEKNKLSGIAAGAEVNVQANWTEADNTSDAYIQNKPNLASVATSGSAADVSYDNTNSGMTADDVQEAVDELKTALTGHTSDSTIHVTASDKTTWNGKQDALTFDSAPTASSTNPVTSGGVKTALDNQKYFYIDSDGYGCINYDLFQTA